MADEGHRLVGGEDLPGDGQDLGVAAQLVGGKAAGNHQRVEAAGVHLVHRGIGGDRIAVLAQVGLLAQARHDAGGALLLEADLGVPELEVLVEGGGEEEDALV